MARVTIEDCLKNVKDRFELVMLAAQRTRELNAGAKSTVESINDKMPVVALREIAANVVNLDVLMESAMSKYKRRAPIEMILQPKIDIEVIEQPMQGDADSSVLDALLASEDAEIDVDVDVDADSDIDVDVDVDDSDVEVDIDDEENDAIVVERELIDEGAQIYSDEEENLED